MSNFTKEQQAHLEKVILFDREDPLGFSVMGDVEGSVWGCVGGDVKGRVLGSVNKNRFGAIFPFAVQAALSVERALDSKEE